MDTEQREIIVNRLLPRLREAFPDVEAILLKGSQVRGNAGHWSDIDFDVLLAGECEPSWPWWFEPFSSGRLVHVSIAVESSASWFASLAEPQEWAFGLGVRAATRLLWAASDGLRDRLDRPFAEYPPGPPELEDTIEALGKLRAGVHRGDGLAARTAAQEIGRHLPSLLCPLNPDVWVGTRREALEAILSFPVAPPDYQPQLLACLGLDDRQVSLPEILDAGEALVLGILELLAAAITRPDVAARFASREIDLLASGELQRYLRQ